MKKTELVEPGRWLGVLGGGQLGRMFTHAAQRLGYHVAVFEPQIDPPAAQAADRHFSTKRSSQSAEELLAEMAQLCDVITLEFENISTDLVRQAERFSKTHPHADFLRICQDRIAEKTALTSAGFPTTPFQSVTSPAEVVQAADELGWPLVLKTARSGYDGKGQAVVHKPSEVESTWQELGDSHVIAEKWIEFQAEVSLITARNLRGDIEAYPLFENGHVDHILDVVRCPVTSSTLMKLEAQAKEIGRGIAEHFGVVGLFCVEFFVAKSGELMINEIAPRPHNSGHLTIEAFACSQFEQQVRAICNLPLIPADSVRPAAMVNLLGDVWQHGEPDWAGVLSVPAAHLHLYGKSEPRAGRKMGHITVLDETSSRAADIACELRSSLRKGS